MPDIITNFDLSILHWISDHLFNPVLDFLMPIITKFGDAGIFWILVSLFLMATKKYRKAGFSMGIALLLGLIFGNGILKNVIARPRPYDFDPSIVPLLEKLPSDLSFPSGHTLASFEAATALTIRHKKFGVPALVLAVLIALSRLYLQVHYPTDVLAGLILGVLFAFLATKAVDFIAKKIEENNEKKCAAKSK